MREYAQIHLRIWDDDDFRELSTHAQRLYLLLLSHPTLNNAGVGDWRPARLSVLAGDSKKDDIVWASHELQRARFVFIDDETEEFLVRSFIRNDTVLRSRNMGTAVAKSIKSIASRHLKIMAIVELQRAKCEEIVRKGLESKDLQPYLNREIPPNEYKYAQLELNDRLNEDSIQTSPIIQSPNQLSLYSKYNPQSYKKNPELYAEMTPYNKQLTTNNQQRVVTEVGNGTSAHTHATPQHQKNPSMDSPWAAAHAAPHEQPHNAPHTPSDQPPPNPQPEPNPLSNHHGFTPDHNPAHWSTEQHPRCEQHAHIPAGHNVPPCHQCANAKAWFQHQKTLLKAQRRHQIDQCNHCDHTGMINAHRPDGTPYAYRCTHTTRPKQHPDGPQTPQNPQNDQPHQTHNTTPQNAAQRHNTTTTHQPTNTNNPTKTPKNKHTFENKTPPTNTQKPTTFNPNPAPARLSAIPA